MFLTTEANLQGRRYQVLRVIHATKHARTNEKRDEQTIEEVLGKLTSKAIELQADGVIGVHISRSVWSEWCQITVMGTAVKFY